MLHLYFRILNVKMQNNNFRKNVASCVFRQTYSMLETSKLNAAIKIITVASEVRIFYVTLKFDNCQ